MQLIIDSPRITISNQLHQLIQEKLTRLEKLNERIITCRAVLRKEKNDQNNGSFIEVHLALPGKIMFASEQAETFEIALDRVVDDLGSQLQRYKTRHEKA